MFLQTRAGLISARAIVRMAPFVRDAGRNIWAIDYELGGEPLKTTAFEEDVSKLLKKRNRREP